MVADTYKRQFVRPVLVGTNRPTIQGRRGDQGHARVGQTLQHCTAMRIKYCQKDEPGRAQRNGPDLLQQLRVAAVGVRQE